MEASDNKVDSVQAASPAPANMPLQVNERKEREKPETVNQIEFIKTVRDYVANKSGEDVQTATWQYVRGALLNPYLADPWNYVELIIGVCFFRLYYFHSRTVSLRNEVSTNVKIALEDPVE